VQSKLVTHGTQLTTQQIMPAEWLTLSCEDDCGDSLFADG